MNRRWNRMKFTIDTKTGDIVTKFPGATTIFKENKIDFCCGGNRPIGEVLHEKQLPLSFLDDLNKIYENSETDSVQDWARLSEDEIVALILTKYHQPTMDLLAELSQLVDKVAKVHGGQQSHLLTMQEVFIKIIEDMTVHFQKEEVMLFPHIKMYGQMKSPELRLRIGAMIEQMEREHDDVGNMLRKLREVTNDYRLPETACTTYRLAYLKLEVLETLTFEHIHTENNILFPRFA